MVLKGMPGSGSTADKISESRMENEPTMEAAVPRTARAPQPRSAAPEEDDDDTLSYFSKLAQD